MSDSDARLEDDPAYVVARTMARWWARTTPAIAAFHTEGATVESAMTSYSHIYALAVTTTWMQSPALRAYRKSNTPRSSNISYLRPCSGSGKTK